MLSEPRALWKQNSHKDPCRRICDSSLLNEFKSQAERSIPTPRGSRRAARLKYPPPQRNDTHQFGCLLTLIPQQLSGCSYLRSYILERGSGKPCAAFIDARQVQQPVHSPIWVCHLLKGSQLIKYGMAFWEVMGSGALALFHPELCHR